MSGPVGGPGDPGALFEALRSGRIQGDQERLRAATSLMESSFYQELFKAMRDTVPESGLLDGGGGEDMFASMLDQHVADAAASRAESGLARALYRQLTGMQEGQAPGTESGGKAPGVEPLDPPAVEEAP